MADITNEIDGNRERIFHRIKTDIGGIPLTILEFMSLGNPDTHYRHFMILPEGNLSYETEDQIADIFKKHTTRKCELHFNGDILIYEIGPMYRWVTSLRAEIINAEG